MDIDAVVYYFIWLSMKPLNMTSSEKHLDYVFDMLVFVTICSLGISTGFGKKKNSVTHSLFTMQSSLFSLNLSLFPLFVLGKHFMFILHLAFSHYESFAESVVGFNFIIGFWFSYNVSYVIFLDSMTFLSLLTCPYTFPFFCHWEITMTFPHFTTTCPSVFSTFLWFVNTSFAAGCFFSCLQDDVPTHHAVAAHIGSILLHLLKGEGPMRVRCCSGLYPLSLWTLTEHPSHIHSLNFV